MGFYSQITPSVLLPHQSPALKGLLGSWAARCSIWECTQRNLWNVHRIGSNNAAIMFGGVFRCEWGWGEEWRYLFLDIFWLFWIFLPFIRVFLVFRSGWQSIPSLRKWWHSRLLLPFCPLRPSILTTHILSFWWHRCSIFLPWWDAEWLNNLTKNRATRSGFFSILTHIYIKDFVS